MRSLILWLSLAPGFAYAKIYKRAICTVESLGDPLADDVTAITAALQKCGHGGSIVLPANQTFHVRSTIDLSLCRLCSFQIDSEISISSDWDYWSQQSAVFDIRNATNAIIHSDDYLGSINANNFGWVGEDSLPERMPTLFSISDRSYQIYVRNLPLKDIPGAAFHVSSGSNAVRIDNIYFETPASTGYLVEQIQHVYVYNSTIRATESCVSILPNSSNVQVQSSTCITTGTSSHQTAVELQFGSSTEPSWIRNIFIYSVEALGNMNVVSLLAGSGGGESHPVEIKNATFRNMVFYEGVHKAVEIDEGQNILTAEDVLFVDMEGKVQEAADLTCTESAAMCDIIAKDWDVAIIG